MKKIPLFVLLVLLALTACMNIVDSNSTRVSEVDGMTLMRVPAGEFLMGSDNRDAEAAPDEKPQHPVYVDAFWIDRNEITNALYARCVEAGKCSLPVMPGERFYEKLNQPVQGVAWTQAVDYCQWAGRRLPTEAEWEKAGRGTDGRLYPWGNTPPSEQQANFDFLFDGLIDVGQLPVGASPYGALDMAGNVWEWTADRYDENYYAKSPYKNPTGPESGTTRVVRGGAWNTVLRAIRVTNRHWAFPGRDDFMGFRCAQDD
jgi:formylglycine-generating enzyme required for sulfatase activity